MVEPLLRKLDQKSLNLRIVCKFASLKSGHAMSDSLQVCAKLDIFEAETDAVLFIDASHVFNAINRIVHSRGGKS